MKKTILATITVAAALLASAPLAKANAFLEVISGGQSASTSAVGPNSDLVLQTGAGGLDGWYFTVSTGTAALAPINIDVGETALAFSQADPLTVIYRTAFYRTPGTWKLITTSSSTPDLSVVASAYSFGHLLASQSIPPGGGVTSTGVLTHNLGVFTEIIVITPIAPGFESVSVDSRFDFTPNLPDGGMTMAMLGSVLLGLAGLRSKFGKRA